MEGGTTGISPSWKNPRERLRKHLKRGNSSRSLTVSFDGTSKESSADDVCHGLQQNHSRSNPFKRSSPMKKRRKDEPKEERVSFDVSVGWDDSNANDPFSNERVLRQNNKMKRSLSYSFVADSDQSLKESLATDFSDIFCGTASPSKVEVDTCFSDAVPTDLRLGTKLRIVSKKPYPWMRDATSSGVVPVRVTAQQKHEGLQAFLKIVGTDFQSQSSLDIPSNVSPVALLEAACFYWQFPCLPWLAAYPRIDSLVNVSTIATETMSSMSPSCVEALDLQW
ncbi:hypothetical protein GCK32_014886 [Trichostrongylus colubriformis]|uniref:Uncharacterized protein n=1 Tax=Trichostrongylus colubriformis TaxID=6319 RepID=A0AAN8EVJ4_TRICO